MLSFSHKITLQLLLLPQYSQGQDNNTPEWKRRVYWTYVMDSNTMAKQLVGMQVRRAFVQFLLFCYFIIVSLLKGSLISLESTVFVSRRSVEMRARRSMAVTATCFLQC